MLIDSHHHLWQIGQNDHQWPTPDLAAIHRDFSVRDLNAAALGLDGTVLVQSQSSETDTLWLLDIAQRTSLILGVVGWTDLSAVHAPERIRYLAQQPKLKGLRPMLQGLSDDDWILRPNVKPALETMVELGLSLDALVFARHLKHIAELARTYPDLSIIIDHGAKPPIARAHSHLIETAQWRDAITAVATHKNVTCKLSGLVTEMAVDQPISDVIPYIDHLMQSFGADRLMFGSDWPVVNLRTSWHRWYRTVCEALNPLTPQDQSRILGLNAINIYRLQGRP